MKINKILTALFVLMAVFVFTSNTMISVANSKFFETNLGANEGGSNTNNSEEETEEETEENTCTEHEYVWKQYTTADSKNGHKQVCKNCDEESGTTGLCSNNDVIKNTSTQHYNHCNTCGRNWNYIGHTWEWQSNETQHWQKCSNTSCAYETEEANHTETIVKTDSEEEHDIRCSVKGCPNNTTAIRTEKHQLNQGEGIDEHKCECGYDPGTHHSFNNAGYSGAGKCLNELCNAHLHIENGEGIDYINSLPAFREYYMIGYGGSDWEKEPPTTVTYTTNYTPYSSETGTGVLECSMRIQSFEHGNYAFHAGNYNEAAKRRGQEAIVWPKDNIPEILGNWKNLSATMSMGEYEELNATYSNRTYTITGFPSGHYMIHDTRINNSITNGLSYLRLYRKGDGPCDDYTPIYAYLNVGYRDMDGNLITGAPEDLGDNSKTVVTWLNGNTGAKFTFSSDKERNASVLLDLETLDELGWRYKGYKYINGTMDIDGYIGSNDVNASGDVILSAETYDQISDELKEKLDIPTKISSDDLTQAESGSFNTALGNQIHTLIFFFEPVQVTVNHINSDRAEIITNKNCTYDLPKLITQTGHTCTNLDCTEKEITEDGKVPGTVAEVHNNTSLNKYLWPGYILTNYSLKTADGKVVKNYEKTYDLINNYPIEDATTRMATSGDNSTYGLNIPRELYQKTVSIPTNVDTGDKVGYRKDLVLDFIYSNVDVTVSHRDYKTLNIDSNGKVVRDGELLKDLAGNELAYVQTLNGHYFIVSSLITQGTNVLTQTNGQYNITGSIIRRVDITKKNQVIYTKEFELKQSDEVSMEALSVTNLLYYILSSNDITDASLMREINRIGNDIEFKFYYEKVPMLTIKHQDELGNKLWPDEYIPLITDPTGATSKDLTRWSYVYKEYLLDNVSGSQGEPIQENSNSDVRKVNVPLNGTADRVLIYIYKQDLPKLKVEYIDEAGNKIAADTEYTMDKDSVTTSAKDLSGLKDADGNSYEYRDYKLYEGDTTSTPLESNGTNVSVTVNNTGKDRLLQFIYKVKQNAGSIDSSQITSESIILKSNYRDTDEEYNVLRAIPTSEDLYANVITDSFLLSNVIRQADKTEKVYVKLVQPYYMTNNADDGSTGVAVDDDAYAISSEGYVELDLPYSYFSARDVQLNIISRAVVKNGSIVVRDNAGNIKEQGQVTLTPNYEKEPELYYVEGGNLVIKGLNEIDTANYADMAGKTVEEYIDYLRTTGGKYDVQYNSFYNVEVKADGIYVEYVLPEVQYTEVTEEDMAAIVKRYKDNTYLLTKAAEENDVRVTMDTLKVIREDNSVITILSGAALPINREYTLIQLESQVDEHGNPLVDTTPDAPLISNNVLYKNTEIYVEKTSANVEYTTTADVWYKPRQRVNPDTLTVETIDNNDVFINSFPVYELSGTPGEILVEAKKNIPGNSVFVHTPVVNNTTIYENNSGISNNQLIDAKNYTAEQKKNILVLGHEFTIRIPNNGTHLNEKGYGNKTYNYKGLVSTGDTQVNNKYDSFASEREIRFTFGVMYNGTYYGVNEATGWTEWIKLGVNDTVDFKFTAPEWEEELWKGTNHHTIETKVIAENATTTDRLAKTQANANTAKVNNEGNYVATKSIEVKLIGEMLDLEIRATNDPGWTQLVSSLGTSKFPIGQPGQNKVTAYKYGLKLGTKVYFDITTTGWTGDTTESINIKPEFYYASKDGNTVQKVDLYYKENAAGQYVSLDNKPIELGTVMSQDVIKGTQYISRFAGENGEQGTFAMDGGRELSTTYNLLKKYGKELVNYGQKISLKPMINLPYSTRLAYTKAIETLPDKYEMILPSVDGTDYCIGHWYGAMRLPSTTIAVPEGGSQPKVPADGLKDGYIIVKFEEVIGYKEGTPYLDYEPVRYNLEGATDDKVTLPNGEEVDVPGEGTPAIIYELIADKVDYENGMIY